MEYSEEDKMKTLTRDNKIEVVKAAVSIAVWCMATSMDLSTFVVLNMILTFVASTIVPTEKVRIWIKMCDGKYGQGSSVAIPLITTSICAAGVWYLLNWIF